MDLERLGEVREAYKEQKQLEEKIAELECKRISPRSTVYGVERVQTSMKGDTQPEAIAAVDKLIALYNDKLQKCCGLIAEFEAALESLTAQERRLMRHYYIDCMTWEQICVKMDMSWTNVHRIKNSARSKITGEKI